MFAFNKSLGAYELKARELADQITEAQANVFELEKQYDAECLESSEGGHTVTVSPSNLRYELDEARNKLQGLEAAKRALAAQRPEMERQAKEREDRRKTVEVLLKKQATATQALEKVIDSFVSTRAEVLALSDQICAAIPRMDPHQSSIGPGRIDGKLRQILADHGITWATDVPPLAQPAFTDYIEQAHAATREDLNRD